MFSTPTHLDIHSTDKVSTRTVLSKMAFHRFQQLPAELRLHIWECAINESRLAGDGPKRVCRIIATLNRPSKLATMGDLAIGYVCHESREVYRRFNKLGNYIPAADVVYVDDYNSWIDFKNSLQGKFRHIAVSADFCYDMLKIRDRSPTSPAFLGYPCRERLSLPTNWQSDFFTYTITWCPKLESIAIVLPPLEGDMPNFADHFPLAMRPAALRIVSPSEIQTIRITGPYAYKTYLRGSSNTERRFLGSFIKDVNEVWERAMYLHQYVRADDHRRTIKIQAGVLQYLV